MIPMTEYPAAQMMKGRRRALRAQDPEGVRQNILAIATNDVRFVALFAVLALCALGSDVPAVDVFLS